MSIGNGNLRALLEQEQAKIGTVETEEQIRSRLYGDELADEWTPPADSATGELPQSDEPDAPMRPKLVRLSDVTPRELEWLWQGRLPLGKLSVLAGDPGLGKSTVTMDLSARFTTGAPMPDGTDGRRGSVIIISAEDDIEDTIVPRLIRHHADLSKIHALQGVEYLSDDGKYRERAFCLDDLPPLEDAIKQAGDCIAVFIDPMTAYMGKADSHKNAEVRAVLAGLSRLAADHRLAVVGVSHLNKGGGKAIYRTMGSLAFVAAARAAWAVVEDQQNPQRRMFLPVKNNLAPNNGGLAYSIIDGAICWERDPITDRIDDVLNADDGAPGPDPERRQEAAGWLAELLADGPKPSDEVRKQAKSAGIAWRTIRRAKDSGDVPVKVEKCRFTSGWQWRLMKVSTPNSEDVHPSVHEQHGTHGQHGHLRGIEVLEGVGDIPDW